MENDKPIVADFNDPDWDDNPEWTDQDFARARPASEFHPPEVLALLVRPAGRPVGWRKPNAKQSVTLRLSADVLSTLRASGKGWQTRLDDMLRKSLEL